MEWDTVIGLEVHAQLSTASKLFSASKNAFGAEANTLTSYIDAGLPGVLPVLNEEAVTLALRFGLAVHAEINDGSSFERKNYFYPDLPKGYQISQFQNAIVTNGYLQITSDEGKEKSIHIVRAHLEEDAGKSVHDAVTDSSGIDLNRAGIPLLEIVTAPCISSSAEAIRYLKKLHQLLRFLNICDGNMQEGSFRCDVNLSLKPKGSEVLGTRTELKNLNSFRYIEQAIHYEQSRHQDLLEAGQKIRQETRLYSVESGKTQTMRSKEAENDYRYFPDPDLLPIKIPPQLLAEVKAQMLELPSVIEEKLSQHSELHEEDIQFLLNNSSVFLYFEDVKKSTKADLKTIINWLKGPYTAALKESSLGFSKAPVSAKILGKLLNALTDKEISNHQAKSIFSQLLNDEKRLDTLLLEIKAQQTTHGDALENTIKEIMTANPEQVNQYKAGKEKLLAFFVGQVMKKTKGSADPSSVNDLVKRMLKSE